MKKNVIYKSMLALALLVGFASCSDDDSTDPNEETYNTKVYITDGPIDNADVQGVYVTIADLQIDGQSVNGFTKTTIDLQALQNGDTQLLGDVDLTAETHGEITLVLDTETDANGNSPANYVFTTNDTKVELTPENSIINVNSNFDVSSSTLNEIIIDFDLRKSIVADVGDNYDFAAQTQLENSIRVVNKNNVGAIMGTATNNTGTENMTIVYAYAKGSYNATTEESENAAGVRFANAVTSSAATGSNNQFSLHFLNEGDYEVHFASYDDLDSDGVYEFTGMVEVENQLGLNLLDISVMANTEVTIQVLLMAILDL